MLKSSIANHSSDRRRVLLRTAFIGAVTLIGFVVAVVASYSLGRKPSKPSAALAPVATIARASATPAPTATPPPPTAMPLPPTPTAIATALPDRTACDEIRGTDYRSETEQEWFRANCSPVVPPSTQTPPDASPTGPEPGATPSCSATRASLIESGGRDRPGSIEVPVAGYPTGLLYVPDARGCYVISRVDVTCRDGSRARLSDSIAAQDYCAPHGGAVSLAL
jgi:hypothetical protein